MKIKRIFAQDMRQAIRRVREEHGPDAVILSSKPVTGGVEVISAIDFDQAALESALAREQESGAAEAPSWNRAPEPAAAETAAATEQPSFWETLSRMRQGLSGAGKPAAGRRRIDVSVNDALEQELQQVAAAGWNSGEESESERAGSVAQPTQSKSRRSPVVDLEWTQEPALREMRGELKTLRSLFENQLSIMDWKRHGRRHPSRTQLLRRLSQMGFGPDICRKVSEKVAEGTPPELGLRQALAMITRHLKTADDALLDQGGVVAVVGPTGVGKTTTVAKLAARFALRHGRQQVALVSTDNFRIGALDQLRSFGRIMRVPVQTAADAGELAGVLTDLGDKRLVLIDTAGMSQRDMRLAEQFRTLKYQKTPVHTYLVVSANTQMTALNETARAFRGVGLAGCVITKTDETASLGGVLTMLLRQRLPAAYVGNGQRIPEDLQPARSGRLVQEARALAEHYDQPADDDELAFAFAGHS